MSDNLKDLIDKAEQEERTRSELQKALDKLTLENATLRKKLDDVNKPSRNKINAKPSFQQNSEEIDSLKKIITSQREQLEEKEQQYAELERQINNFNKEVENLSKITPNSSESQVLIQTKESIENILEDYGRLENMNTDLTNIVKELEEKNYGLNKKLQILENDKRTNVKLEEEVNTFKDMNIKISKENEAFKQEISKLRSGLSSQINLKENIGVLKSEVSQKNKEIDFLKESLNKVKNDNMQLKKLESLIPNLEAEINRLKQQENLIKEKDSILLAKTITAMTSHEKIKTAQSLPSGVIPKNKAVEQKVQDPVLFSESKGESKLNNASIIKSNGFEESIDLPEPQKSVHDLIAEEISNGTSAELIKRKWECPKCGNIDKSKIREIPDKSRIIYGSLYAKKYKCGLCANEWH